MKQGLLNSKKADVSITLLTFMAIFLCAVSLVLFLNAEKRAETAAASAESMTSFYMEEEAFRLYLYNLAREVMLENTSTTEEKFLQEFKQRYSSGAPEKYLAEELKSQILGEKYAIEIEEGVLYFRLMDFAFSKKPGLAGTGNGIGYIESVKDIYFEIQKMDNS